MTVQLSGDAIESHYRAFISRFVDVLAIACFTIVISLSNTTWIDYPHGADVYSHLTKIRYILEFWPNDRWNFVWAGGTPFLRWYGPIPAYLIAFFTKITGFSIYLSFNLIFLTSVILFGAMLYLVVGSLSENDRLASLTSALLAASPVALWYIGIEGGMYPRIIATALFSMALYFLLAHLKQVSNGKYDPKIYFATVLTFSLTIVSHQWVGFVSVLTFLVLIVFCVENWKSKLATTLKIFVPSLILSAYYLIPFSTGIGKEVIRYATPYNPFAPPSKFTLSDLAMFLTGVPRARNWGLSVLTVPLMLTLLMLTFIRLPVLKGKGKSAQDLSIKTAKAFGVLSIFFIIYPFLGADPMFVFFLIIYLPVFCGILVHHTLIETRAKLNRTGVNRATIIKVTLLILIVITTFTYQYPITSYSVKIFESSRALMPTSDLQAEVQTLLANESVKIANYRFGYPGANAFSYLHPRIPQTGHWDAIGVLRKDTYWWFEVAVWGTPSDPTGEYRRARIGFYPETNFLLDWFAVKWFVVPPSCNTTKFLQAPNFYQEIYRSKDVHGHVYGHLFVYQNATAIVSPTVVPTLLFIGPYEYYRIFAYADYDSRYVIPIFGQNFIDDFTLEELKNFDVVLLYDYNYHDSNKAWSLLEPYIKDGGSVIIDTGTSPEVNASFIPLPSPVDRTSKVDFGTEWHFSLSKSPITDNINFSHFDPAIYGTGPWAVSSSFNESVRSWAKPVLYDMGYPVVVSGEYGKGRIVWSGLNLPYHISVYHNFQEALFLGKMVDWASKAPVYRTIKIDHTVERVNPEKVVVTINNPSKGVLFKEFHFDNWLAYSIDANGVRQSLQIYEAGPYFMYARLPRDAKYPIKVIFEYGMTWIDFLSDSISVTTLLVLTTYSFAPSIFKRAFGPFISLANWVRRIVRRLRERWYEE